MDTRICLGILTAALAAGPAAVHAQEDATPPPSEVTAETIAAGKKLFSGAALCSACHGAKAEGGVGPNLTDDKWLHSKGTYEDIVGQIIAGVPAGKSTSGVPMPPKGGASLDDAQIKAVAAYVWSLSHKPAVKPKG